MRRTRRNQPSLENTKIMGTLESITKYEHLGPEFLMWLWHHGLKNDGKFNVEGCEELEVRLGEQMVLEGEMGNASRVQMKGEMPAQSSEFHTALQENKTPQKVKLLMKIDGADWALTLDSRKWSLGGIKIPVPGAMFFEEACSLRLNQFERFSQVFLALFDQFLALRFDARKWNRIVKTIKTDLTDS
ncbi:hypothetical protein JXA32_12510 [Candidatus Sumerlaeota bacterium]|nr:hypothetical protein [Candidatus Sumerlaeota bacterium]